MTGLLSKIMPTGVDQKNGLEWNAVHAEQLRSLGGAALLYGAECSNGRKMLLECGEVFVGGRLGENMVRFSYGNSTATYDLNAEPQDNLVMYANWTLYGDKVMQDGALFADTIQFEKRLEHKDQITYLDR